MILSPGGSVPGTISVGTAASATSNRRKTVAISVGASIFIARALPITFILAPITYHSKSQRKATKQKDDQ
jgi:hypothetical protein